MEKSILSLKTRVNFYSYFGIVTIGICLWFMHNILTFAFGTTISGIVVYGITAICLLRSLYVALMSKEILTSEFQNIVPWFNSQKKRLGPIFEQTDSANKSVSEASEKMGVKIEGTLVADESVVNAFQAGIGKIVVVFYRGLLQKLDADGVRGVAFHEVAHAKNKDLRLTITVISFIQSFIWIAGFIWQIAKILIWTTDEEGKKKIKLERLTTGLTASGGLLYTMQKYLTNDVLILIFYAVVFWFLGNIVGQMVMSLISINREYLADATATEYGAGPGLIKAFTAMKKLSNTGTPKKNSDIVSKIGISAVPGNFLNLPSHPKMDDRIKNIQNLLDGKEVNAGGGFMYFVLILLVGTMFALLKPIHLENQISLLGIPLFYFGLLCLLSKEIFFGFTSGSANDVKEENSANNNASSTKINPTAVFIALAFVIGTVGMIVWQTVSALGSSAYIYVPIQILSFVSPFVFKNQKSAYGYGQIVTACFTLYMLSMVLN